MHPAVDAQGPSRLTGSARLGARRTLQPPGEIDRRPAGGPAGGPGKAHHRARPRRNHRRFPTRSGGAPELGRCVVFSDGQGVGGLVVQIRALSAVPLHRCRLRSSRSRSPLDVWARTSSPAAASQTLPPLEIGGPQVVLCRARPDLGLPFSPNLAATAQVGPVQVSAPLSVGARLAERQTSRAEAEHLAGAALADGIEAPQSPVTERCHPNLPRENEAHTAPMAGRPNRAFAKQPVPQAKLVPRSPLASAPAVRAPDPLRAVAARPFFPVRLQTALALPNRAECRGQRDRSERRIFPHRAPFAATRNRCGCPSRHGLRDPGG